MNPRVCVFRGIRRILPVPDPFLRLLLSRGLSTHALPTSGLHAPATRQHVYKVASCLQHPSASPTPRQRLMSYWPFSTDSQAKQPDQPESDQPTPSHNTRSAGLPPPPPLAAGRAKSGPRSPAALANPSSRQHFFPPNITIDSPTTSPSRFEDADDDVQVEDIFNMASSESEIDRLTRVAEAAIAAATAATNALASAQSRAKKPELPSFDKKNVELWIQRVESAYTRANVTLPKDKFAFLEPKFPVDFNSVINGYLFGDATEDNWRAFLAYLRDEYGRTVRQQTATLLSSHSRSGLRPTQFLVNLKEKTKKVKLDDIHKEILLKSLPSDVQHLLLDKIDSMTASQAAQAADKYFDSEGRPISTSSSSSVNAVQNDQQEASSSFTAPFSDDEADVNHISRSKFNRDNKFGGGNNHNNNFRSKPRPFSNASSNSFRPSRPNSSSTRSTGFGVIRNGLCYPHEKFKSEATTCYQGCKKFDQHKGKKVYQGNDAPERRA